MRRLAKEIGASLVLVAGLSVALIAIARGDEVVRLVAVGVVAVALFLLFTGYGPREPGPRSLSFWSLVRRRREG